MSTRSFLRSLSVFALGVVVLLGAGCGRDDEATTSGPSAVTPVARGACDHPYYPLRAGYEVRYASTFPASSAVSTGGYALKVTASDTTSATLVATFDPSTPGQSPITAEQQIDCTDSGLRARSYMDFGSRISGSAAANQFRAVTRGSNGEMLPRDIRVGSEWRGGFDVRMEATSPGPESPFAQPIDLNVLITRRAVAEETIRVPAGEYQAMKVIATTDLGMGSVISGTEWWVRGVGMVKSTYDLGSGSENIVTESMRVTVPE